MVIPTRKEGEVGSPLSWQQDYSADELEFMNAMHRYKELNKRWFPTWHEVLAVVRALGYRKVEPATEPPRLK